MLCTVDKSNVSHCFNRMDKFFTRLADDLETYAVHAKRKTIEVEDVELLLKRWVFCLHEYAWTNIVNVKLIHNAGHFAVHLLHWPPLVCVLPSPGRVMWMTRCQWKCLLQNIFAWSSESSWSPSQPAAMLLSLNGGGDEMFQTAIFLFIFCLFVWTAIHYNNTLHLMWTSDVSTFNVIQIYYITLFSVKVAVLSNLFSTRWLTFCFLFLLKWGKFFTFYFIITIMCMGAWMRLSVVNTLSSQHWLVNVKILSSHKCFYASIFMAVLTLTVWMTESYAD